MQRMGIDYGKARIGLALGALSPREFGTIKNTDRALSQLAEIIKHEEVDEVILGDPIRADGQAGTLHKEIDAFALELESRIKTKIIRVNEAFTTTQAESEMREQGVDLREMKERVDQYSAKLLLEQYNNEHPVKLA